MVFVAELTAKPAFLAVSRDVFTSPSVTKAGIDNVDDFGDDFVDALTDAVQNAGLASLAAQKATLFLDTLRNAPDGSKLLETYSAIKNAPDGSGGIGQIYEIFKAGVSPNTLEAILKNDIVSSGTATIPTSYTRLNLFEELSDVAKIADELDESVGLSRLVVSLKNTGSGRYGFRFELEVAADLAKNGSENIEFISKLVERDGRVITDIDIISNGIYYQVKRSAAALKSVKDVKKWVGKALADGADSTSNIAYVIPQNVRIPTKVADFFAQKNIAVIRNIDFK